MKCYAVRVVDRGAGWITPVCFYDMTTVGEMVCLSYGRHGCRMDYSGMFL